jgi:hypothetical protein
MKTHRAARVMKFVAIAIVAVPAFGFLVMLLWNWLVPPIFGWNAIGFWQALGLFLLARILVGGMHGGHGDHPRWRERMLRHWERMTPEEREKVLAALRRSGGLESKESESPA